MGELPQKGQCVLLVEDEAIVAINIEYVLRDLGYDVLVASHLAEALDLLGRRHFDMAVLDVNLNGTPIYPVADRLREQGVPFLFATGYSSSGLDPAYADIPRLPKPIEETQLKKLLARLTDA